MGPRFGLALLLLLAAGCAGPAAQRPSGAGMEAAEESGGNESGLAVAGLDSAPAAAGLAASPRPGYKVQTAALAPDTKPVAAPAEEPAKARSPVLIYTANLTMAVFDVQPGLKAVETAARELGGFLARQSNNTIIVRVPAARFHEALARMEKLGDVTARDIEAQDVTAEYLDLELRIKSARSVRERLEQLLNRASKVEESIAIERELERVMAEIERMEGRLKYLRDRAQFSTISVTFAARPKELVAKDTFKLPFPWLDQLGLGRLLELR